MRNQLKTFYSVLAVVATLGLTTSVHGVPAFARQTGLDCTSCHAAPGFPTLNAFGQAFKAGGYTQANEDNLIGDGEALSIPKSLNVSVVVKEQAPIVGGTDATGTDLGAQGSFLMPDEMALLIGGRIGKNVGFLIESALRPTVDVNGLPIGNSTNGAKLVFAPELGPVRLGIVPWFSDLGPQAFFETQSNDTVHNQRPAEELKSAGHQLGAQDIGELSGLGLYVWHPMGYVAVTPFYETSGGLNWLDSKTPGNLTNNTAWYVRAAVTPTLGPVALGVGFEYYAGKYTAIDLAGTATTTDLNIWVVDAQAFMDVGLPLTIMGSFGMDGSVSGSTIMAYNVYVEAGIVPDVFMAGLIYNGSSNNNGTNTVTADTFGVAVKYHILRNLKLEVDATYETSAVDGTPDKATAWAIAPILFGAF